MNLSAVTQPYRPPLFEWALGLRGLLPNSLNIGRINEPVKPGQGSRRLGERRRSRDPPRMVIQLTTSPLCLKFLGRT
jgi:hypothetical protein